MNRVAGKSFQSPKTTKTVRYVRSIRPLSPILFLTTVLLCLPWYTLASLHWFDYFNVFYFHFTFSSMSRNQHRVRMLVRRNTNAEGPRSSIGRHPDTAKRSGRQRKEVRRKKEKQKLWPHTVVGSCRTAIKANDVFVPRARRRTSSTAPLARDAYRGSAVDVLFLPISPFSRAVRGRRTGRPDRRPNARGERGTGNVHSENSFARTRSDRVPTTFEFRNVCSRSTQTRIASPSSSNNDRRRALFFPYSRVHLAWSTATRDLADCSEE